jgi:hypothetical protein
MEPFFEMRSFHWSGVRVRLRRCTPALTRNDAVEGNRGERGGRGEEAELGEETPRQRQRNGDSVKATVHCSLRLPFAAFAEFAAGTTESSRLRMTVRWERRC